MPKVYNKRDNNAPPDAILVDRSTPWGNPFHIHEHRTREQVVQDFQLYVERNPVLIQRIKDELKGKDLVCWCYPQHCHADILLRVANEE